MLRTKLTNGQLPCWAINYLNSIKLDGVVPLLDALSIIKITKRNIALPIFLQCQADRGVMQQFYINKKGQIVFCWANSQEKVFFLLKWS